MDLKVNLKLITITGLLLVLMLSTISARAQTNIVRAEYFINEDPGFGLGVPIDIGTGTTPTFDVNFVAETDTLSPGYHFIYVRSQDELGVWSYLEGRSFYIIEPTTIVNPVTPKIVGIEYFINEDPGQGLATYFDVADDFTVDIPALIAQTDTLSTGYHIIGTRAKTEYGNWGWYERRSFYITTTGAVVVPPVQKIVDVEYYFDDDPGQGQATSLGPYTPNLSFDLNELIPTSLSPGYHTFNVRSQAENGHWGFVEQRPVYVITAGSTSSITDINKIEYFFDGADPGVGQAINLPITPSQTIELNTVDIPTSPTLVDGEHYITFRARNGNGWGLAEIDTFDVLDDCTQPIAAFTPQIACAGQPVTFIDESDSIQGDATYRWYLNGDAIIDDTTVGNATFTYPFPGTYVVALAIRQGTICLDSITTTVDIQSLPIAVFSTSGTEVDQPVFFTASASNLPDTVYWSWDFDDDLIVDDTTSGNTSFIYTVEGTYNPTLAITDSLGCGVTVTNPITISGTGTSPPFVDFLADNSCVGSNINFIDLSQNLPAGSTYSWDFDGDGGEDDVTAGSSSFSYSAAGSYDAKLIIDIGIGTIEAIHTIQIVDFPIADFSATDVCEGSSTVFTDLSTNTEPSAVYMWDFNNDGAVDSNAKTGITYLFTSAGPQIVSLTISNGFGCTNTIVKQVNVIGLPTPDFDWGAVCTSEPVSFNNLSTGVDVGAIYSWDLDGDGNEDFSTAGDVDFTFATKGIYNASLTIANISGCEITATKPIEIYDRPEVDINVLANCYGQESQMLDLSQKVSPTATYSWDFESDGTEDDITVGSTAFTYTTYNSYLVNLIIDNGGGCAASTDHLVVFSDAATPDFSVNKLCEGEPVVFTNLSTDVNPAAIYSWDYDGDGLEDSAIPGSTVFTYPDAGLYNATLTIDNGSNCLANKVIPLDVTPPPTVDLGLDTLLCVAGTIILDAHAGYTSYLWPDGSTNQTYTIDQIGSYMVRVQDAKSCYNTDTIAVGLLGDPVPSFDYSFDLSYQGVKVIFANTSTNADTTLYLWDFGDGTSSNEIDASYIFTDYSIFGTSIYTVCLTATNDCGVATICEDIFVSPTQFMQEGGSEIQVYPNPVEHALYIEVDLDQLNFNSVALIDSQGRAIWSTKSPGTSYEINMSEFPQGVYLIILEQDDKFLYKKVVKN